MPNRLPHATKRCVSYAQNPLGSRADNLEVAISCYEQLMGNIDPKTEQAKRHLTIKKVEDATKPQPTNHQEAQTVINTYHRKLTDAVRQLQPSPPAQQPEKGSVLPSVANCQFV